MGEDESKTRAVIAAERTELADVLAFLPAERWDEETLCAGWRVRETVAHITMAFRYSMPRTVIGMVKARGSFDRMADRSARDDARSMTPKSWSRASAPMSTTHGSHPAAATPAR